MKIGISSQISSAKKPLECEASLSTLNTTLYLLTVLCCHRFRWVFCQLDKLRRCLPGRIRSALDELPRTLDATYERTLEDIDEENWGYAHRLFQCIAVALRPLRAEELAEFLAIDFEAAGTPTLVPVWRPENPANAVLSACSSLIAFATVDGSQVVQFSHFSVQEFLMSSRLASGHVSRYHISFEPAHTTVAQACLSVLLQLDSHINKSCLLEKYPLARYAAQHWLDHIKFPNVSPRVEFAMARLFDRDRPHFAAWVWIYLMDQVLRTSKDSETPLQPNAPPIYYATLWDLPDLAEWLAAVRSQEHDVNEQGGYHGTPLCAAAARGCLRAAQVLVKHGADVNAAGRNGWPPLLCASDSGHLKLSRLMLDHGADVNFRDSSNRTPLSLATGKGHLEISGLLLQRGANANVWESGEGTVLIKAIQRNHLTFAQFLLTYGADVNARTDDGLSLLHLASEQGKFVTVRWLLKHGAGLVAQNNQRETALLEGGRRITGMGAFLIQYFHFVAIWLLYTIGLSKLNQISQRIHPLQRIRLPDVVEETRSAMVGPKRRALLVGISYHSSSPLDGPHKDVDCVRELLIGEQIFSAFKFVHHSEFPHLTLSHFAGTYGYAPNDITVLKDDPKFPNSLQPTRANMVCEACSPSLFRDVDTLDRF
jgi:ankyrin repeat protein